MNRSKYKYWISRRPHGLEDEWAVCDQEFRIVTFYPEYYYDDELINKICKAKNDNEVIKLVQSIPADILEEHRRNLRMQRNVKNVLER